MHSTKDASDGGAVHVLRNRDVWEKRAGTLLKGNSVSGARFGSAIGGLADINLDGYNGMYSFSLRANCKILFNPGLTIVIDGWFQETQIH